jgi:uncharacterized membrane protein
MQIKKPTNKTIIYALTLLFAVLFLLVGNRVAAGGESVFGAKQEGQFVRARVLEVVREEKNDYEMEGAEESFTMTTITFDARALSGAQKGKTIHCIQEIDNMFALVSPKVVRGNVVLLDATSAAAQGTEPFLFYDYVRTTPLIWLGLLFSALVILFGRKKGFDTVLSFALAILVIFAVLVPAVLSGRNIYLWSLLTCVFIVLTNLMLVQGPSAKSLTAALGCLGGVLTSGVIMLLMNRPMHITGLMDEESIQLKYLNIDIKATVFCMIMVGSVGALMDVAMDIAAALHEMREHDPAMPASKLMRSGFHIGQDLIGTMANTLVLAYIGGSMGILLVMINYSANMTQMVNKEMIAVEILQSLAGCLSVLAVVPLTSFICSVFYRERKRR